MAMMLFKRINMKTLNDHVILSEAKNLLSHWIPLWDGRDSSSLLRTTVLAVKADEQVRRAESAKECSSGP